MSETATMSAWVALIYLPQKESQSTDSYESIMKPSKNNAPVYPFSWQRPPVTKEKGLPADFQPGFTLRPGCNLQVPADTWKVALSDPMVAHRVKIGAIEIVPSDSPDSSSPGYRHFKDTVALDLVRKTEDIDSLELWVEGESRNAIIDAANKKKAAINAELIKRAA